MTQNQTIRSHRITFDTEKQGARSVDVGALTSVFEKSATEFK